MGALGNMSGAPGLVRPDLDLDLDLDPGIQDSRPRPARSRPDPDLPGDLVGSVGLAGGLGVENQEATCHRQED